MIYSILDKIVRLTRTVSAFGITMALYIEPPRGNISLKKLETFAHKRLEFLMKIYNARGDVRQLQNLVCEEETVTESDCLIIGTAKDKVSHFALRLLLGGDPDTCDFFCEAETALFDFRFSCMSKEEMNIFFKKLNKQLCSKDSNTKGMIKRNMWKTQDFNSIVAVFNSLKNSAGSWEKVTDLYLAQCSTTFISLPFQSVLGLLSKRQVILKSGVAGVAFSKLREVVVEQFLSLMQFAVKQACRHLPSALGDDRLRTLWRKLKHTHKTSHLDSGGEKLMAGLSLEEVDTMATNYPLCMSSLLQSLRQKHRLGHHARIQLTLFFKDMGLPVHHAIALWQQEYSQPCGTNSRCRHSWQKDSQRYTYGIRHLYGLEGRRRSYHGHCCQSLQQRTLSCGEEGGCPFSHWDDMTMSSELTRSGLRPTEVADILTMRKTGCFSDACLKYLHCTTEYCGKQQSLTDIEELRAKPSYTAFDSAHARGFFVDSGVVNINNCSMGLSRSCDIEDMDMGVNDLSKSCFTENIYDLSRTHLTLKESVNYMTRTCEADGTRNVNIMCSTLNARDFSNKHPSEGMGSNVLQENVPLGKREKESNHVCGKKPNSGSAMCCFDYDASQLQTLSASTSSSIQISRPVHFFSYKCLLENLKM